MNVDHSEQAARIRRKLAEASRADAGRHVFGAASHDYRLGPPLPESRVAAFEADHGIRLPSAYRAFLRTVGHGPGKYPAVLATLLRRKPPHDGAGPHYGLHPLPEGKTDHDLTRPALFGRSPEDRDAFRARLAIANDDDDWDALYEEYYGGLLLIGTQGCSFDTALVVTGAARGRIAYTIGEMEAHDDHFLCHEDHFLDWYERWLDEVIAGDLSVSGVWFGSYRGGTETVLLRDVLDAPSTDEKREYLLGLRMKLVLSRTTLDALEIELSHCVVPQVRAELLFALAKHDYGRAKAALISGREEPLTVLKAFHWFARDRARDALPLIEHVAGSTDDAETFRFCCYVLSETGDTDAMLRLLPTRMKAADPEIRRMVVYTMGNAGIHRDGLSTYLRGLGDPSLDVVLTTLQAIGFTDPLLRAAYHRLLRDFSTDEGYIRTNVQRNLQDYE